MKVCRLLDEQKYLEQKYFSEDISFGDEQSTRYKEVSKALLYYLQIEDKLNNMYANSFITVSGYCFTVATGLNILRRIEGVCHDPVTGELEISTHPIGIFLSMCSSRTQDIDLKLEQFLDELRGEIERFNIETEIDFGES